jgi:Sec-independent protein secretion pathway component TatC
LHKLFSRVLPLEHETTVFVLVNTFDIFVTYLVLRWSAEGHTRNYMYESNAVARFVLDHWGIKGMVYFKLAVVALVAVIAQVVATQRIELARRLLIFGSLIVGAVVAYSLVLLVRNL